MAIKSTIYKAQLQIADIDHGYYADYALTLARHPSETDERMMVRLVALAMNAHEVQDLCQGDAVLAFGAGLSDPDDPDVSITDYTGRKRVWIEVGQPEEKPMLRACSKSDRVLVYAFAHSADIWWRGIENKLHRNDKLKVIRIPAQASQAMAAMAERSMQLQATIQEGGMTLSSNLGSVHFEPVVWR
jgi:uncharacterized protein YaeQ